MSSTEFKPVVTAEATPATKPAATPAAKPAPQAKAGKAEKKGTAKAQKAAPKAAPKAALKAAASKVAPAKAAAKADKTDKAAKLVKEKKIKMMRDSFTIPKHEFEVLAALKLRAAKLAAPVKKTELIRAGIKTLAAMSDSAFIAAVQAVPNLKTGRPAKNA